MYRKIRVAIDILKVLFNFNMKMATLFFSFSQSAAPSVSKHFNNLFENWWDKISCLPKMKAANGIYRLPFFFIIIIWFFKCVSHFWETLYIQIVFYVLEKVWFIFVRPTRRWDIGDYVRAINARRPRTCFPQFSPTQNGLDIFIHFHLPQ